MKSDSPREKILELIIKRVRNPFYICVIVVLYWLNDNIKIIKTNELAIAICGILICIVLLKDTIYKCLDRLCKRDENIEKEKTKRLLSNNNDNPSPDNKNDTASTNKSAKRQNYDGDVKVYDIKHRKPS